MRSGLQSVRVLIIEPDPDTGELLARGLTLRGATVRVAGSGAVAMHELAHVAPDVLLCDIGLPDGNGFEWLARFRTLPGIPGVPAIAVSGHASAADREHSLAAGFEKHLNKPASLADIIAAISALVSGKGSRALRSMLSRLSELTGCRYTSLLRFNHELLVSVWTYDRCQPNVDPFPLNLPIEASYCILVRRAGASITIENAAEDERANGHPKQHELATYVAAPVFRADGEMYGTLCSYDPAPRTIGEVARAAIRAAARELEGSLHGFGAA